MSANIENLIKNLGANEVRVVEDYIHSLSVLSGSRDESKQLRYFKLLVENKNITEQELSTTLNTKDFKSLKRHLSVKIHDALLQTKHIWDSEVFSEREQTYFDVKKKILLIKILYRSLNKGRIETIEFLLSDTIKTAKEYEFYDILFEALTTQKYLKGIRSGTNDFEKINAEIKFYNTCLKATQTANDAYYQIILDNSFVKILSKSELNKHIHESIKQLESDFKITKSQEVNYYLHILRMAFSENEKDYGKCVDYCTKIIKLLNKSKVIYTKERIGFALINSCHFQTYLGKYKEAIKNAQNAQVYYKLNSFNYLIAKEQEFYTHFYSNNFSASKKTLSELLDHDLADTGQFRKSKFIFYNAYILFNEKNFKEAQQLLNKSLSIEKDKTRWNISLRILNIMIYIEQNKTDEASTSLESLRKYIEREDKSEINPRKILIIKLLRELEKDQFQLNKNNPSAKKMLKQLSEEDTNVSWEYFSAELSPFHLWVDKK